LITLQQIEELREYFSPKPQSGARLPDVRSVADGVQFIVDTGITRTLYIMYKGKWNLIGNLTEV
jgi:hypothetical protein